MPGHPVGSRVRSVIGARICPAQNMEVYVLPIMTFTLWGCCSRTLSGQCIDKTYSAMNGCSITPRKQLKTFWLESKPGPLYYSKNMPRPLKSYCEKESGVKPLDWNALLAVPYEKQNEGVIANATRHSVQWTTCACGAQCHIIPRGEDEGEPLDDILYLRGSEFHARIVEMQNAFVRNDRSVFEEARQEAIQTLRVIEKRSTILIRRIRARKAKKKQCPTTKQNRTRKRSASPR